jgi:hypothetical protein
MSINPRNEESGLGCHEEFHISLIARSSKLDHHVTLATWGNCIRQSAAIIDPCDCRMWVFRRTGLWIDNVLMQQVGRNEQLMKHPLSSEHYDLICF